jgi:hypothetical protein
MLGHVHGGVAVAAFVVAAVLSACGAGEPAELAVEPGTPAHYEQLNEQVEVARQVVAVNPNHPLADEATRHRAAAIRYRAEGDLEKAIKELELALGAYERIPAKP